MKRAHSNSSLKDEEVREDFQRVNSGGHVEKKKKTKTKKEEEHGIQHRQREPTSETSNKTRHHHEEEEPSTRAKSDTTTATTTTATTTTTTTTATTRTTGTTTTSHSGGSRNIAAANNVKRRRTRRVSERVTRQLEIPQYDANGNFIPAKLRSAEAKETKYRVVKHKVFCKVDDCGMECISLYSIRVKVCVSHLKAERAKLNGIDCRFCQKCTKFHELSAFMKDKRACIASLNKLAKIRSKTTTKKASMDKTSKNSEQVVNAKTKTSDPPVHSESDVGCSVDHHFEMKRERFNKVQGRQLDEQEHQHKGLPNLRGCELQQLQRDTRFSSEMFRNETVRKLLGNIPSREGIDPKKEAEAKRRKEIVDALYKNEIRGRWERALG